MCIAGTCACIGKTIVSDEIYFMNTELIARIEVNSFRSLVKTGNYFDSIVL